MYQIKALAELGDVSIRTLRHYDKIGLLRPASISEAGYRLYNQANLEQLQHILYFKAMGFALKEIGLILNDPHFDRNEALKSHREGLLLEQERLTEMISALDLSIQAHCQNREIKEKDMFKGISMKKIKEHQAKYEKEVKSRWGKTAAYEQSNKKTAQYGPEKWKTIQAEVNQIYQGMVESMSEEPGSKANQMGVAQLQAHFTAYYYDCTLEILAGLGQMYIIDERFKAFYDEIQDGFADHLSQAIAIFCEKV